MRKSQQKELQRLEDALLEEIAEEDFSAFGPQSSGNTWQLFSDDEYTVYNTDESDVDIDRYSEEVFQEPAGRGLSVFLTMLLMFLLASGILVLLKIMGVL